MLGAMTWRIEWWQTTSALYALPLLMAQGPAMMVSLVVSAVKLLAAIATAAVHTAASGINE